MTSSRSLVLEAPRELVERVLPVPTVREGDAVLRIEACGLCGTDHEQFTGMLWLGSPFIPGHESVGVIEEIGRDAARRWGVAAGDRVAVEVFQSCGDCRACAAGTYRRCVNHGIGDMYGFIGVDRAPGLWGGYAQRQYLAPDSMLLHVPPEIDPVVATLFNPLGAGIRWGVTLPGTSPGDVVAILGPGVRGLSACCAAREAGAGTIMVTGAGARDAGRLELAASFGADLAVDVTETDPVAALRDATGGRLADVVVDVTARAPEALSQAVALAAPGGTVVVAGVRGAPVTDFDADLLVYKDLRLLGAFGVDVDAYRAALDMLATGRWPFTELPRRVAGFADTADLLTTMAGEGDAPPPVHGVFVPEAAPST